MKRDHLFPVVAMLVILLTVWLGIAGPIVDAIIKGQPSDWLGFFGNILAALGTILAAYIAWRAVQPQLAELRLQSAQRQYEQLRSRARELEDERLLLYLVATRTEIMNNELASLRSAGPTVAALLFAGRTMAARDEVTVAIDELKRKLGPPWGTLAIQQARSLVLENAYQYANVIAPFVRQHDAAQSIDLGSLSATIQALTPIHDTLMRAATRVHTAIDLEVGRIGRQIEVLERRLL